MSRNIDRLISTGWDRIHYLFIALLMTLIGGLYVLGGQPAYDPSILAMPDALVFVEYLGLFIGGVVLFGSFVFRDKLWTLNVQFWGLAIQTAATVSVLVSVLFFGASPFIVIFGAVVAIAHGFQLKSIDREIKNAPAKRSIAESVEVPGDNNTSGDLTVQTMLFLQSRVEKQAAIIKELRASQS